MAEYDSPEVLRLIANLHKLEPEPTPRAATKAQGDLEAGGAACALRARGIGWDDIGDSLGIPSVAKVRQLAAGYLAYVGTLSDADGASDAQPAAAADGLPDVERSAADFGKPSAAHGVSLPKCPGQCP